MARRRLRATVRSYGIYEAWAERSEPVPRLREFTTEIPAVLGIEFGMVLQLVDGSGAVLDWNIDHPPFLDRDGRPAKPFTGTETIRGNDYQFYLGDCIWAPWQDKCGLWTLTTSHAGRELARRIFVVVPPA